jgi:biotin carboxyl carrier protein
MPLQMPEDNKAFKVAVNDLLFSFCQDEIDTADLVKTSVDKYNMVRDHRSVSARVTETGSSGKELLVEIDGESYHVLIKDELDQMLDNMGYNNASSKQIKEIKAPMPGLVIEISVNEGQQVKEGERILILEAMKMENSIMIQSDATIKKVSVAAGQAVDKGQVLVELA